MQVTLVPVASVDQVWPHVREGMQKALLKTGGDIDTGDLWVQCRNGSAFLLLAHDGEELRGASIWRPDTWQSGKVLRCLALYGVGADAWLGDMKAAAIRLANECGATSLVSEGRAGWQKVFPKAKVLRMLYREPI